MRYCILLYLLAASSSFSAEHLARNDCAMTAHVGNAYWRGVPWTPIAACSAPLTGRETVWITHYTCPEDHQQIEAFKIPDLIGQQLVSDCAEEDSASILIDITFAWSSARVDSMEDNLSQPFATMALFVPYEGLFQRTIYVSMNRPRGDDGDLFIQFLRDALIAGQPFILRFRSNQGSGVLFTSRAEQISFVYTTNEEQDPEFVDTGPPALSVLTAAGATLFQGPVLRGAWHGDFGKDHYLHVAGVLPNGQQAFYQTVLFPDDGRTLSGNFCLGVSPTVIQQYPSLRLVCNPVFGGFYACAADSGVTLGR